MKTAIIAVIAAGALALGATACTSTETSEPMTIDDAWSRKPADGQTRTAVYGVINNPNDTDVTVTSATVDVDATVELHETITDDNGTMSMQEVPDGYTVEAGGSFTLAPGGAHIMLLDIDAATYPDEIEVTLNFDGADPLTFTAEVRDATGSDMGGHMGEGMEGHMGEGNMGEGSMGAGNSEMHEQMEQRMDDMSDQVEEMEQQMDDIRDQMQTSDN